MPKAARINDTIAHTNAFAGMLVGLAAGVLIGAAVVATGGAGLVFVCAAAATGAKVGGAVGKLFTSNEGVIVSGADTVRIGRRWAARAVDDKVDCHAPQVIAQGSRTVVIEDFPAARIGDKTACDGTISSGSANVEIGMEPGTYAKIGSEIPLWLQFAVEVLDAVGSFKLKGGKGKPGRKSRPKKKPNKKNKATNKRKRQNKKNRKRPTQNKRTPQKKGPKKTRRTPPKPKGAKKEKGTSSKAVKSQKKDCGDPVDVATGAVVDTHEDLALPGVLPVRWTRHYASDAAREDGPFGIGGWSHDFDQWIEPEDDVYVLHAAEGREVYFEAVGVGEQTFHRAERLTLTVMDTSTFEVFDHSSGLTRRFAAIGSQAYLRYIEDANGNRISLHYEGGGLTRIDDSAGRHIFLSLDGWNRITQLKVCREDEVLQWVDFEYHPTGELASVTDALGHAERYEYDNQHCMTQKTLRNGVRFYYAYDEDSGRCASTSGDGGLFAKDIDYDERAGTTAVHGEVESRFYEWDERGAVLREATYEGEDLHVCSFDADGYLLAEGPHDEHLTTYEYDSFGNRTRITDPAGNVTEWTYDGDLPSSRVDPGGATTLFEHDARGNLMVVRYPSGIVASLSYDPQGRLVGVRENDRTILEVGYDAWGNVAYERDARGATTKYEHDGLGRPIAREDALGRTTMLRYDPLGRVIHLRTPDGAVQITEYDAMGNPVASTDAAGRTTAFEYTGTGVLSRLTGTDGESWLLSHDADERLVEIKNPAQESFTFQYDEAGRIIEEKTFDRRVLRYRHNAEGLLDSIDLPDGTFRSFGYDAVGNVISDVSPHLRVKYDRDSLGRVLKAELSERSGKVVTELIRDELGRVVAESQNGQTLIYRYDAHGRRTERVLPDGTTTRYCYDAAGDLAEVEHNGQRLTLERDRLGRERSRRAGACVVQSAYDEMDRLIEQKVVGAHDTASLRTWKYDALGRVAEVSDARWGTTAYRHNGAGELVEARRGPYREIFQYDPAGSLRAALRDFNGPAGSASWDVDTGNVLQQTGGAVYEHDACGRRTKKVTRTPTAHGPAGAETRYLWDERDRLREVVKPDGERVIFTYDAFGRRVKKEVLGSGTTPARRCVELLWDQDELAAEIDSARGTRSFVHEPGTFVPILHAEQGEVFAVVTDHVGLPKELVDADGRVAWSASHSAWGEILEEYHDASNKRLHPVRSPFRLLGQYADEETGLVSTRFRYFDPETGRWCSPDPLGIDGGLNLYAFDGSPVDVVDPLGLACKKAAQTLPRLKGKSVNDIQKTLKKSGFTRSNPSNPRNQRWVHSDGSEVQIHAYGGNHTGPHKSGNNAHVHKSIGKHRGQGTIELSDRGLATTNEAEMHIGISNPVDFPIIAGRPHGT